MVGRFVFLFVSDRGEAHDLFPESNWDHRLNKSCSMPLPPKQTTNAGSKIGIVTHCRIMVYESRAGNVAALGDGIAYRWRHHRRISRTEGNCCIVLLH